MGMKKEFKNQSPDSPKDVTLLGEAKRNRQSRRDTQNQARKGCGKKLSNIIIPDTICGEMWHRMTVLCPSCEAKQEVKPIILDDNPLSIASYAEEFPENWKKISKALAKKRGDGE